MFEKKFYSQKNFTHFNYDNFYHKLPFATAFTHRNKEI